MLLYMFKNYLQQMCHAQAHRQVCSHQSSLCDLEYFESEGGPCANLYRRSQSWPPYLGTTWIKKWNNTRQAVHCTSESAIPKIVSLEKMWNLDQWRMKLSHTRCCESLVLWEGWMFPDSLVRSKQSWIWTVLDLPSLQFNGDRLKIDSKRILV